MTKAELDAVERAHDKALEIDKYLGKRNTPEAVADVVTLHARRAAWMQAREEDLKTCRPEDLEFLMAIRTEVDWERERQAEIKHRLATWDTLNAALSVVADNHGESGLDVKSMEVVWAAIEAADKR